MDIFCQSNWKCSISLLSWNMQSKALPFWVLSTCIFTLWSVFMLQMLKSDCFALDTPGSCSSSTCPCPLRCLSYSAESEHLTSEMKHFCQKKTLYIILFTAFGGELLYFVLFHIHFSSSVKQYEGCTQLWPHSTFCTLSPHVTLEFPFQLTNILPSYFYHDFAIFCRSA